MNNLVECASTGTKMPESQAREVDDICKTLPAGCGYRTKAIVADDIHFEPGERAEVSIISTSSVDKAGEVVLPQGIDLTQYRKSMVVLWNHDHERPVASCQWIKHQNNSIRAKTIYPEGGTELTENAWLMTKSGVLKAKSIGFIPRTPLREPCEDELGEHPEWKDAGVWDDTLMIEYSTCSIGMCHDAPILAVNNKSVDGSALTCMGLELPTAAAEPVVKEVVKSMEPGRMTKAKTDDCVSKKIKWLHENEPGKYSDEQIVAIAYANCKAKGSKPKKSVNMNELLQQIVAGIKVDPLKIARMAEESYKNRGRV